MPTPAVRDIAMAAPTTLTKLLALRHPVLLAPMAGVSGGLLAAAVSRGVGWASWARAMATARGCNMS